MQVIERDSLDALFVALRRRDFRLLGPTLRDGVIVYDELTSSAELPAGWSDTQEGGAYRLTRRNDAALFGYAVGPHSWKQFLHPPTMRLWQARRDDRGFHIVAEQEETPRFAFLGVRSCELHAIAIQDTVFLHGSHVDPVYQARRDNVFIVAVNCGQAGGTCFCVSMHTGPKATFGFDLALTEVLTIERHYFVVETGTARGAEILEEVPHRGASEEEQQAGREVVARTAAHMGRTLDTTDLKDLLYRNYEHPRWDEVANRCLTCGNCTMVCPTCFCTTVEDTTDLTGEHAERWRQWDSCFTMDFSYIHGGSVRASAKSRYRQWLTHKLATWIDQFGASGCVGCGRCITWCPVAIDITAEISALRASDGATFTTTGKSHDTNA
jgi:ferredoxin